ncbi:ABC transporter substrate-binding protein [Microbacterium sp. NPDC058389]|uniref:ABC transporter substrate-binding protein n=1 Tax=Microbacterium sp. NPDC058389 TaxID=3346475 RepID=UPI00364DC456
MIENFSAQMYTLGRNPNYWQKLEVPELSLRSYSGNDQISAEVAAGNIDWGGLVPDPDKTFVPRDPEHNHYWWPQTRSVSLQVNTTKGALGDAGVRRALSMAVDRERIIDQAVWGKSDPANATALPEGGFSTWLDADVVDEYADAVTLDVDAAAALLDDLGYAADSDGVRHAPDGTALEYSIVIPTGWSDWITAAQVVAQDLTAVGVKVELQTIAYDSWADEVYNGEFDMTLYGMPSSPNPYSFYLGAMSQETLAPIGTQSVVNAHRFADPEATQLLQDYTAITDPDAQVAAMAGIEARFAELLPLIPLYNAPDFGLYTTTRFDGFPNEDDPYAPLSLQLPQKSLLVFPHLRTV